MRGRIGRFFPAAIAAILGIWASFVVFLAVDRGDEQRISSDLQLRAEWRTRELVGELHAAAVPVASVTAHLSATGEMDPASFAAFAKRTTSALIPIESMAWRPRVAAPERDAFVRAARQKHYPTYQLIEVAPVPNAGPAAPPVEDFPILHEVSFYGRPALRGLGMQWDPRLWKAAMLARDEGKLRATLPLDSIGVEPGDKAIVLIWPVYRGGDVPASIEARRAELAGFVTANIPVPSLLGGVVRVTPLPLSNIRFFVEHWDDDEQRTATEIASYSIASRAVGPALGTPGHLEPGGLRVHHTITAHGQTWQLLYNYPAAVVDRLRSTSRWAWLGGMLLATLAVVIYLGQERSRRGAIERVVADRTAALTAAYGDLQRESRERELAQRALSETGETLRALVDGSAHAIVAIAPDRSVLQWNKAAERIFGHATEDVVGKPIPVVAASGQATFDALFASASAGQVRSNVHFACLRSDGTPIEVRCGGAPFYDGAGKLRGVAYMLEDVTDQMATEAMLRQAQKMEAVGTLTGGLAHDFNNLLTIVTLNLESVLDLAPDAEARERVERALSAAEKGGALTRQLLTFARQQPLQPQLLDLNTLIGNTVKLLDRTLGEQVVLRFEAGLDLPMIVIDGAQLDSAIVNLAVNARDAMPEGGLLSVRTRLATLDKAEPASPADVPAGHYAVVEISDTGAGMTPDVLKRIFEPFFSTKGPGKGTGLGLSMVFGFMKQSRGYTTVRSAVGRGTTFRLYLPLDTADTQAASPRRVDEAPVRGRREKILVVDDNPQIRQVIIGQLGSLGYRAVETSNPMDALRMIDTNDDIDLLFTDIVMPGGMNGFALARAARVRRPDLPVLTSSGFPGEAGINGDPDADNFPMLTKPYRREQLAAAVAEALSHRVSSPTRQQSAA